MSCIPFIRNQDFRFIKNTNRTYIFHIPYLYHIQTHINR
ncbi:hypothetical protein V6Z12_D02G057200 [Gossypium hirsutum]